MTRYDEFILRIREDGAIEANFNACDGTAVREQAQLLSDEPLRKYIDMGIHRVYGDTLSDRESLVSLGEDLYRTVFPDAIGVLFEQAVQDVQQAHLRGERDRQVRLVIDVDPKSDAYHWPLELMRCPRHGYFLGADRNLIALSRRLIFPGPKVPPSTDPPLQVLIIVSKPCETEFEGVIAAPVLEAIAKLAKSEISEQARQPSMMVKVLGELDDFEHVEGLEYFDEPATFGNILKRTEESGWYPHVLHFIGHANFDRDEGGALGLVDAQNEVDWCSADDLVQMFTSWRPRLVLLQACESAREKTESGFMSLAAQLVQHGIPAVVVMQFAIRNDCVTDFITGIYDALQQGQDIDSAVQKGRWKIASRNRWCEPDFGAPVLFQLDPTGISVTRKAQGR